jgi:kynurenine formamidase
MHKLIDLTMPLSGATKAYGGDPAFSRKESDLYDSVGALVSRVEFGLHNGTHVDAPKHFVKAGKSVDAYPIERFSCKGVLVDALAVKAIGAEVFQRHEINRGDAVLVRTDHSNRERFADYFQTNPVLSSEAAQYLAHRRPSLVGIDSFSPDNPPFEVHKILLGNDVLLLENLVNLSALEGKAFKLHVFPLKLAGAEAAPCRAVAETY